MSDNLEIPLQASTIITHNPDGTTSFSGTVEGREFSHKDSSSLDDEYPEVPTTTTHNADDTTTFHGIVSGTTFAAAEPDPPCTPGVVNGSNCQRICGDLPSGRRFLEVVFQSINPGNFARFGEIEVFNNRNPVRICFRCKNWAQQTSKLFVAVVRHGPQ
jgi:hypothetical protein